MLCDSCKKADAVVHLTKIENGKRTELHLCAACAEKEGILINGEIIFSAKQQPVTMKLR